MNAECRMPNAECRGAQCSDTLMLGYVFAAAELHCGLRVCGWCKKWLGLALDHPEGAVTHGMCEACEARMLAEIEALPAGGQGFPVQSKGVQAATPVRLPVVFSEEREEAVCVG